MAKKVVKHDDEFLTEDGEKATLVTKEGLALMVEQLEEFKTVKRKEVAVRLKEAISFGDLSENSEYEDSKNEQAFVEGQIIELEKKIKNAKIITESKATKTVQFGSTVSLKNLSKKGAEDEVYTLVGSTESNPFEGKISNESPIGFVILDKCKGDIVKVISPSGTVEYEIVHLD